ARDATSIGAMSLASPLRAGRIAAMLLTGLVAGCAQSESPPTKPVVPVPTRQVTATVVDTTGTAQPGIGVDALRVDQTGDPHVATTTASGVAQFTLHDGRWCMYATEFAVGSPTLVAGSTGQVAHRSPPAVDSVSFRLVLRPQSIARGKITLSGQTMHAGTIV